MDSAEAAQQTLLTYAPRTQLRRRSKFGDTPRGKEPDLADLNSAVHQCIAAAYADTSQGTVRSAMNAWVTFSRLFSAQRPEMIRTPRYDGDLEASTHNELSLMQFAAWMQEREGAVNTICSYVSLVKTNLGVHLGWRILEDSAIRLPRFLRGMRRLYGRTRARRRRLGWRAQHHAALRRLLPITPAACPLALAQDALLATARDGLLRSCEITVAHGSFDGVNRHPRVRDIDFEHTTPEGEAFAVLTILPAKKPPGQEKNEPVHLARGAGVVDAFSACARMIHARAEAKGGIEAILDEPLFLNPATRTAFTAIELRSLVRSAAAALGLDTRLFGAHSPRIGGATDLYASGCPPISIQIQGRWDSDLWSIYARQCIGQTVGFARRAQDATDVEIEVDSASYTQPARVAHGVQRRRG